MLFIYKIMNTPPRFSEMLGRLFALVLCTGALTSLRAQTTVQLTGGDPGQGLTLNPAQVVHAYNILGSSNVSVQGVTFVPHLAGTGTVYTAVNNPFAGDQTSPDDLGLRQVLETLAWDGASTGAAHTPLQFSFVGLIPAANYRFDLLYYSGRWASREQAIIANNSLVSIVTASQTMAFSTSFFVQADGEGSISLLVQRSGLNGGTGYQDGAVLNGLVLSTVPEPASAAMFAGLGCMAWMLGRRRRV